MRHPSVRYSSPNVSEAIAYLEEHIGDSRILEQLGTGPPLAEMGTLRIVTASPFPPLADLRAQFGGKTGPCEKWLVQKAVDYLSCSLDHLVLFEDPVSAPTDSFALERNHPPFWTYEGRVYWPVLTDDVESIERSKSWVAGFRDIVFFARLPFDRSSASCDRQLSEQEFGAIASSVTWIVTDVFRGQGYLEWQRRALH